MKHIIGLFVCAAIAALLPGCGGGSTTAPAATGRLTLRVVWPLKTATSTTRLIPIESNSIQAVVTSGSQTVGTKLIVGGDGAPSDPSTVTFNNLPPGPVTLTATAYPTQQGTGVAQATGSQTVTIVSGQTATVSVTMASTIDHITITPANPSIAIGQKLNVTMNAFDASGNMVLSYLSADFQSANTAVFKVTIGGNPSVIEGIGLGSALLTVSDSESGSTASTTVTVVSP